MNLMLIGTVTSMLWNTLTPAVLQQSEVFAQHMMANLELGQQLLAQSSDWGKRATPVPLGGMLTLTQDNQQFQLGVSEVLTGQAAIQKLTALNSANPTVRKGYELVVMKLALNYQVGDEEIPFKTPANLKVFSATGEQLKAKTVSVDAEYAFADTELYPGASHQGYYALEIPKKIAGQIVLAYENGQKNVFFAVR